MGLLHVLKQKEQPVIPEKEQFPASAQQVVVIEFFYGLEDINELLDLEKRLKQCIETNRLGTYQGHDISLDFGDGYFFLIGTDCMALFQEIKPILESYYFMDKSIATVRNGSFDNPFAEERDYLIRYNKLVALE